MRRTAGTPGPYTPRRGSVRTLRPTPPGSAPAGGSARTADTPMRSRPAEDRPDQRYGGDQQAGQRAGQAGFGGVEQQPRYGHLDRREGEQGPPAPQQRAQFAARGGEREQQQGGQGGAEEDQRRRVQA